MLSGKSFAGGAHTRSNILDRDVLDYPLACMRAYNMVSLRDIRSNATLTLKQVARSMTATLLYSLGTQASNKPGPCGDGRKCCTCTGDCIMNDLMFSQSMVIPKCTRKFIKQSVPECLKTLPKISPAGAAVCGNGLVEREEQCDCFYRNTSCRITCDQSCRTIYGNGPTLTSIHLPDASANASGSQAHLTTASNITTDHSDKKGNTALVIGIVSALIIVLILIVALVAGLMHAHFKNKNKKRSTLRSPVSAFFER